MQQTVLFQVKEKDFSIAERKLAQHNAAGLSLPSWSGHQTTSISSPFCSPHTMVSFLVTSSRNATQKIWQIQRRQQRKRKTHKQIDRLRESIQKRARSGQGKGQGQGGHPQKSRCRHHHKPNTNRRHKAHRSGLFYRPPPPNIWGKRKEEGKGGKGKGSPREEGSNQSLAPRCSSSSSSSSCSSSPAPPPVPSRAWARSMRAA